MYKSVTRFANNEWNKRHKWSSWQEYQMRKAINKSKADAKKKRVAAGEEAFNPPRVKPKRKRPNSKIPVNKGYGRLRVYRADYPEEIPR